MLEADGREVAGADFFFQREEELLIRCGGEDGVIEWKEQGIGIGNPAKARLRDAGTHADAVCEHGLDLCLIEDPLVVVETFAGLDSGAGGRRDAS